MSVQGLGLVLALLGSTVAAQETDLPEKARTVLRDNCFGCHGDDKTKADLKILDYAHLVKAGGVVVPDKPDDSELLQLVECGSMPPGTARKVPPADRKVLREWIVAGAPPFPPRSGENYILAQIQADVRKQAKLKYVRYFSLNHLLDTETPAKMEVYRKALTEAVNLLSPKGNIAKLDAIDPQRTIFRIRIDELGWHTTPFVAAPANPKPAIDPTTVNLYDLILLEYPLTPLPNTPEGKELAEIFLPMTGMIRPVPYVRGDWFASVALQSPLYGDLHGDKEKTPGKLPDNVLLLAEQYTRSPLGGTPPLDGLTLLQSQPKDAPITVAFDVLDAAGKPAVKLPLGSKMTITAKNTSPKKKLFLQIIITNYEGTKYIFPQEEVMKKLLKMDDELLPGAATISDAKLAIPKDSKTGFEQLTILASDAPIPPGIVLKSKDGTVSQRVVHPLDKIDFTRVVKKTVTYEVVK